MWITRTAVFIALLVAAQAATAPLGNALVTGSLVNLMLILAVMLSGLASGAVTALISPVMAKLLNIGPLWSLIPFIMLGNLALILVWHFVGTRAPWGKLAAYIAAAGAGAVVKFGVLFLGIVKVAVPLVLRLPEPQAGVMSGMFSVPQLITAVIGGVAAVVLLPPLSRALRNSPGE